MKHKWKHQGFIGRLAKVIYYGLIEPLQKFSGSENYWKSRYRDGGNSGAGSYNELAHFKAEIINSWVNDFALESMIEFGCGDGNQLLLAQYPQYLGLDISPNAIAGCRQRFSADSTKSFALLDDYAGQQAQLGLSLDVIYHLVEDDVFNQYMRRLFASATRYVVIYSSNTDQQRNLQGRHVRHRCFTEWVDANASDWELLEHVPNRYPYNPRDGSGSYADFFLYGRRNR